MKKIVLSLMIVFVLIPIDSPAEEPKKGFTPLQKPLINPFKVEPSPTEKKGDAINESYFCVADMATGFKYNKALNRWEQADFNIDDSKYIVSRSKGKDAVWEVKQLGGNYPIYWCKKDFNESGFLFCEFLAEFKMNKLNLRYIIVHIFGYYNDKVDMYNDKGVVIKPSEDEGGNTPYIEIGKCSSL